MILYEIIGGLVLLGLIGLGLLWLRQNIRTSKGRKS